MDKGWNLLDNDDVLSSQSKQPTIVTTIMPVELKGSCHCGAVKFSVESSTPVPYQVRGVIPYSSCVLTGACASLQLCVCSICRKVGGVGGSINLGAHSKTLKVEGKENLG